MKVLFYLNVFSRKGWPNKFVVLALVLLVLMITRKIISSLTHEDYHQIINEINEHMEKVLVHSDREDQNIAFAEMDSRILIPIKMTQFTAVFKYVDKKVPIVIKRVIYRQPVPTQEDQISVRVMHPNILRTFHTFRTQSRDGTIMIWLLSEYLTEFVSHSTVNRNEEVIRKIMKDVLSALKYLHMRNIAHLDIKMANIMGELKNGNITYKLIDLGYSRELSEDIGKNETWINSKSFGTFPYKSPEIFKHSIHGLKSDIYSLGAVAWFLSLGKTPFYKRSKKDTATFKKFMAGHIPITFHPDTSQELKGFILQCMQFDREKRPTADELLSDPFITNGN